MRFGTPQSAVCRAMVRHPVRRTDIPSAAPPMLMAYRGRPAERQISCIGAAGLAYHGRMDVLPSFIEILDAVARPFEPRRRLRRVQPGGRSEAEWDRILTDTVDVLADALLEAEVIAEDSTLMHLGAQVDNIDLVLAEVSTDPNRELRRLVLVEASSITASEV
jgi:hypothetical protein